MFHCTSYSTLAASQVNTQNLASLFMCSLPFLSLPGSGVEGRFNMEQSNIANQRQRDRGPMKFGTTTWQYMEVMNDDDDTVVY